MSARVHSDCFSILWEGPIATLEESNGNGQGMVLGRNQARRRTALTLTWRLAMGRLDQVVQHELF